MDGRILLIDSYAQIYRAYHAVQGRFTAPDGTPTNAVFAIAKFLLRLEKNHPSQFGAFVFDKGKPAVRMELAPDYKANRPHMPEDMRQQIPLIRELIRLFGWPIIEHEGVEADDLIGSISKAFTENPVIIFSSDKDISQVIDDRVTMMVPDPKGSLKKRGIDEVHEKFGVAPCQIVDFLALLGDNADNIPGVEGVGEKTAAQLLQQFGCGKNIFEHLDEVKRESLRTKLAAGKERFDLNVKLVQLQLDPPQGVKWELAGLIRNQPDYDRIMEICRKLGLKSVIRELETLFTEEPGPDDLFAGPVDEKPETKPESDEPVQLTLF